MTNVAILTPKLVPITTNNILKILLFHKSLRPWILLKLTMSLFLTFIYFASFNPENHPAARRGWIIVRGATPNPTNTDCILDPDKIDPRKTVPPPIKTNSRRLFSILIPFIKARTNITTKDIGIAAKIILTQGNPPFFQ